MSLEKLWNKLEQDEPLTTSEDKRFTDESAQKMDELKSAEKIGK